MHNIIKRIVRGMYNAICVNSEIDYSRLIPRRSLYNFGVSLVEHCNLNCKGCNHFAPIAQKEFINLDVFSADMKRMGELFSGYVGNVSLEGGEPLLHPDINTILEISRRYFPHTKIMILTNVLKIKAMPNEFWKACKNNNIVLRITKYPGIKYCSIEKLCLDKGIRYEYYGSRDIMNKVPIDIDGSLDGNKMWLMCYKSLFNTLLKNGRLYPCTLAPCIHHFSKKFDFPHIVEVPEDSIDIFTHTREEILEFLANPIPMCRYCNYQEMKMVRYSRSKREIDEWI